MGCTTSTLPPVSTTLPAQDKETNPIFALSAPSMMGGYVELAMPEWGHFSDGRAFIGVTAFLGRKQFQLQTNTVIGKVSTLVRYNDGKPAALIAPDSAAIPQNGNRTAVIYAAKPRFDGQSSAIAYDGQEFFCWARASFGMKSATSEGCLIEVMEEHGWVPTLEYKNRNFNNELARGLFVSCRQGSGANVLATVERGSWHIMTFKIADGVDAALIVISFTALVVCQKVYSSQV